MKNKKLLAIMTALLALTFILSACDGMTMEDLQRLNIDGKEFVDTLSTNSSNSDSNQKSFAAMDDSTNTVSSDDSSGDSISSSMSSSSMRDSRSNDLKVKGEVTAVTANSITIGGVTYTLDSTVDLTTLFSVGDILEVEYFLNDDGSLTLYEFQFEDSMSGSTGDDLYTEVKAYITEVTANTITINGQTFTVDTLEDLSTLFAAGQIYEIKYVLNADGTITLLSFELDDDMDDDMDDDDMYDDSDDDMNDDSNNNYDNDHDDNDNNYNNNDNNNDDNDNSNNNNNDDNNNNSSDDNS